MIEIRKANLNDCRPIAELALIAGEGIPAYFWEAQRKKDQDIISVGAHNLESETDNFSYKNVHIASIDGNIAGMLLAYRLPSKEEADNLDDFPEFIQPLIELEQCVPDSFYINMLAAYPEFRNQGIGSTLMSMVNNLAIDCDCDTISVEVFEQNEGAVRLYQRLGYEIVDFRNVIPHPCHPYTGKIFLLTKDVSKT